MNRNIQEIEQKIARLQTQAALVPFPRWFKVCDRYFQKHQQLINELVKAKKGYGIKV